MKLWTTPSTRPWQGICTEIDVTLACRMAAVSVQDNGRGFPVGIHPKMGRPAVEVCLTVLHAGGKFGGGGYKVSGGLHGVGASVVNALSAHLSVQVSTRTGKSISRNTPAASILYDLKVVGETDRTGTTIRFLPDVKSPDNPEGIFDTGDFQFDVLKNRLQRDGFPEQGHPHCVPGRAGGNPRGKGVLLQGRPAGVCAST